MLLTNSFSLSKHGIRSCSASFSTHSSLHYDVISTWMRPSCSSYAHMRTESTKLTSYHYCHCWCYWIKSFTTQQTETDKKKQKQTTTRRMILLPHNRDFYRPLSLDQYDLRHDATKRRVGYERSPVSSASSWLRIGERKPVESIRHRGANMNCLPNCSNPKPNLRFLW